MHRLLAALLAAVSAIGATTIPVRADTKVAVPLPDLSGISEDDAERLLAALAQINVITSNCPDYRISDGEWMLLTGTGDMLAARLGIDPATYRPQVLRPGLPHDGRSRRLRPHRAARPADH